MPAQIAAWTSRWVVIQPTQLENTESKARFKDVISLEPNKFELFVSHLSEDIQLTIVYMDLKF